jgi:hypothetical protein
MSVPLYLFKSHKEDDEYYARLYDEPSSMLKNFCTLLSLDKTFLNLTQLFWCKIQFLPLKKNTHTPNV